MLQATRLMRPFAAAAIITASLAMSVSISASGSDSEGGKNVGVGAQANQVASRTGVTSTTKVSTPPTTVAPPPPPSTPGVSAQAAQVLELMNVERRMRGLQPLVFESRLNASAQAHTVHQAQVGTIFHVAPDGTGPGQRIAATGYAFSTWAENVAAGQKTAEAVMAAWMASPGHCRNILNPGYTEVGIGYLTTTNSFRTWWTQKFARPSGAPVPPGVYNSAWC